MYGFFYSAHASSYGDNSISKSSNNNNKLAKTAYFVYGDLFLLLVFALRCVCVCRIAIREHNVENIKSGGMYESVTRWEKKKKREKKNGSNE